MKKKRPKRLMQQKATCSPPEPQDQTVQSLLAALGNHDDLTVITGIAPHMEMALNGIGIRKFSDFAGYTPQTLSQILRARTDVEVPATVIESQNWIESAELLARAHTATKVTEVGNDSAKENAAIQSSVSDANRSIAHTLEKPTPVVPEAEQESISQEAVQTTLSPEAGLNSEKAEKETKGEKFALRIKAARFEQFTPPATDETTAENMLRSEISCEVTGAKAQAKMADGASVCAQIHAIDTCTSECELMASKSERLQPEQTDHKIRVEFKVPPVGQYQLQIVAFVRYDDSKIALYRGPILRVIE